MKFLTALLIIIATAISPTFGFNPDGDLPTKDKEYDYLAAAPEYTSGHTYEDISPTQVEIFSVTPGKDVRILQNSMNAWFKKTQGKVIITATKHMNFGAMGVMVFIYYKEVFPATELEK